MTYGKESSMIRRHPVLAFYLVVTVLTLFGSWLAFFVFRGSLWVQWIATFSPMLTALVLTALLNGKEGVTELLARLFHWKMHWKWYLAILILPVLVSLGWAFCNTLLNGQGLSAGWSSLVRLSEALLRGGPVLLAITPLMAVLIAGEELGWRGFALERLLKTRGPVISSLIVGFFWGIWHVPSTLDPTSVLNKAPLVYSIPLFTLGTVIFSFVYTWLWQNTHGSLFVICLFHSFYDLLNYFTAALFPSFYVRFWLYLLVMVIILLPVWVVHLARASSTEFARAGGRFKPG
jgi:hypothetical protein